MEYVSGGFHPSDYKNLPIYKLLDLYRTIRKDGLEFGLDPMMHPEFNNFGSVDEALGRCARIYSSVVAVKSIEDGIDEETKVFFKPLKTPIIEKKRITKGVQMTKTTRSKIDLEAIITVIVEGNPKRRTAAERFALYKTGMTVRMYTELVGNETQAVNDVLWDTDHGWIKYESQAKEEEVAA